MSPCEWPVDRSCLTALPAENEDDYAAKLAIRDSAEDAAVSVMWALSGRQFSVCEHTIRPVVEQYGICDDAPLIEAYYRNDWRGVKGGSPSPMYVFLPGPVQEIVTVTIDGVVLDPSEYVLEGDALYRRGARWPFQNLNKPAGDPGTWTVTYLRGLPVPAFVGGFTGQLAAEMVLACEDQKRCKLPRTVVSTSRSGVTHVFDPTRMLSAGFTGIPQIDTWLATVNPNNLTQTARVL